MKYKYGEYERVEAWDLDAICYDQPPAASPFSAVRKINGNLLSSAPRIVKTEEGCFVLQWDEHNPEMLSPLELFGKKEDFTDSELLEFERLSNDLPGKTYEIEISRKEAFAILCFYCLPEEFEREAESLT
jgi:hypothetical protein